MRIEISFLAARLCLERALMARMVALGEQALFSTVIKYCLYGKGKK
jgi:hypothetical protein